MTISSTTAKVSYAGNGVTTAFAFNYPYLATSHLEVTLVVDSTGVETVKTETTHYTVSAAGATGTVTMLTAPASGETLIIRRKPPLTQAVDLATNDAFPAQTVEDQLDKAVHIDQYLQEQIDRSIKAPIGDTSPVMALPTAADRANKALIFDADGDVAVSTDDYEDQATAAAASAAAASASAAAASGSASTASTAATNAQTAETNAETAETAAEAAQAAAEAAQAAAETAETNAETAQAAAEAAAAKMSGTSATSVAIGTGSKGFTTQADKYFTVGTWLLIASDADETNYMHGQVTAYSGTSLTVNVTNVGGAGTFGDWIVTVSGTRGAVGATGATGPQGPEGPTGPGTGDLLAANNLSDVASVPVAQQNLDLEPGVDVFKQRTITGTAPIQVANGDGASANPTISIDAATDTAAGKVELATDAETITGTDAARAVTPAGAAAAYHPLVNAFDTGNVLINGEFRIWQRGTSLSGIADDAYTADRWYVLTQTGTIADARQAAPFDGARNSGQLTQSQAVAQRIGRAQIVESVNCTHLRGQTVTFSGRLKCSASQAIRFVVLEWTGTADSVTSDVVNDWTSATYTASNFFLAASLTITQAPGSITPSAATWTDFSTTLTLGSSFNNLVVFVWTEGTAAQNVTLDFANVGLYRAASAPAVYVPRPWTVEHQLCKRYFYKTFKVDVTPAQAVGVTSGEHTFPQQTAASTSGRHQSPAFPVEMFAIPTITFYNPINANALCYNGNTSTDYSATSAGNTNVHGFSLAGTPPAASSVGNLGVIHFTASAEM